MNREFAGKLGLRFPLLSDEGGEDCAALGILQESGRAQRTTFLIDRLGRIAKIFPQVQIDGHVEAVLAAVQEIER